MSLSLMSAQQYCQSINQQIRYAASHVCVASRKQQCRHSWEMPPPPIAVTQQTSSQCSLAADCTTFLDTLMINIYIRYCTRHSDDWRSSHFYDICHHHHHHHHNHCVQSCNALTRAQHTARLDDTSCVVEQSAATITAADTHVVSSRR